MGSLTRNFKWLGRVWIVLVVLFVFLALPAACVTLISFVPPLRGRTLWLCVVPVTMLMMLTLAAGKRLGDFAYGRLARRIATRLKVSGRDPVLWGGQSVQLAPSDRPCVYGDQTEWDNGYLFLFDDRLSYLGDQTEFSIPRHSIAGMQIGRGNLEWPAEWHVYLDWWRPGSDEIQTLSVWPGFRRSILFTRTEIEKWMVGLTAWAQCGLGGQRSSPPWAHLCEPDLLHVKSISAHRKPSLITILAGSPGFGLASGSLTVVLYSELVSVGHPWPAAGVAAVSTVLSYLLTFSPRLLTREVSYSPSQRE